jgi:hypothetical protein
MGWILLVLVKREGASKAPETETKLNEMQRLHRDPHKSMPCSLTVTDGL